MKGSEILILLCSLVIFSYLFELFAKRTRVPSVLLLMALGMGLRMLVDRLGSSIPDLQPILPTLGTVGLILIVFEGALDLTYERSKRGLIRKAFVSASVLLLLTTAGVTGILFAVTHAPWHQCIANAIPLCVISSAVAVPSVGDLRRDLKEFVVYESSFSDILGIILFNFVVMNDTFGPEAFGHLGLEVGGVVLLSAAFSLALLWLLGRIEHHVKFFLILAILVLVYAVGKQLHLSSLVVVLAFGMFLANADQFTFPWFRAHFIHKDFHRDLDQFHSLSRESAFLLRTFFFIVFGSSVVLAELLDRDVALLCGAVVVVSYALRALFVRAVIRLEVIPLLFISPRGLISILLYISLPAHLQLPAVGMALLFMLVLSTCTIMALGLMGTGPGAREERR